jgi:hypothetical protein
MLILIALMATVVVLLLSVRKSSRVDSSLMERRDVIATLGVQIICGDCAGDDGSPLKTYLDPRGHCNQCGGTSYILASVRGLSVQRTLMTAANPGLPAPPARVLRYVSRDKSDWDPAPPLGGVA